MQHLSSLSPDERAQTIGTLMASLPPAVQGSMNVVGIADAADRLASPQYQAAQSDAIQKKQDWLDKTAKTDPNFKGTPAEYWTDQLANLGVNALTAFIPAPIRNTLWFSQFYADGKDKLKTEHPDWSNADLNSHASASAVVQLASQEALAGVIGGKLGPLAEAISNPFARAGARALTETAIGVGGGGVAQVGANIAEQRPLLENVPQAMAAGAIQGGIPGVLHGAGELRRPAETAAEVTPPTRGEVPTTTEVQPGGAAKAAGIPEEIMRLPATVQAQAHERYLTLAPEAQEKYLAYLKRARLADEGSAAPPVEEPVRPPGEPPQPTPPPPSGEAQPPPPAEQPPPPVQPPPSPSAIDPNEFSQPAIRLASGQVIADWSHSAAWEQAGKPDPNTLTDGYVNDTGQFITLPQREQALGELERQRVEQESQRISQQAQALTPPATPPHAEKPPNALPTEPAPLEQGTDKYVSSIANRFVQQKVEAGDIGEIAAGQGYATKDLIAAGLKMSPEEVTQHMSDLMNGVGDPKAQAAAIRAEEARLSQISAQASKIAEANPGDAQARIQEKNAFDDLTDFHNGPVAKLKSNWHASGMAMQGEHEIDLTTYNGQRENWLRANEGKPPPDALEPAFRENAARAKKVTDFEKFAAKAFSDEVNKPLKMKVPSADEVRNNIMERMGIGPCIT
jgi:hypothetical protein